MAERTPLVMNAGEIEQLQAGDSIRAAEREILEADATLIAGNIVYASAAAHVNKAKADAAGTSKPIGLAVAAITSGQQGEIATDGPLTLTTGEWDAAFGTTGGLTYNVPYYLSAATAGLGTATSPTAAGQYSVPVVIGISATIGKICIQRRVKL